MWTHLKTQSHERKGTRCCGLQAERHVSRWIMCTPCVSISKCAKITRKSAPSSTLFGEIQQPSKIGRVRSLCPSLSADAAWPQSGHICRNVMSILNQNEAAAGVLAVRSIITDSKHTHIHVSSKDCIKQYRKGGLNVDMHCKNMSTHKT